MEQGHSYQSPGFNKLAAQRPRIILDALEERGGSSGAVLYSDVDAVWRSDPLPQLRGLLGKADVAGAQDTYLVCTGFFMFSTRYSRRGSSALLPSTDPPNKGDPTPPPLHQCLHCTPPWLLTPLIRMLSPVASPPPPLPFRLNLRA